MFTSEVKAPEEALLYAADSVVVTHPRAQRGQRVTVAAHLASRRGPGGATQRPTPP